MAIYIGIPIYRNNTNIYRNDKNNFWFDSMLNCECEKKFDLRKYLKNTKTSKITRICIFQVIISSIEYYISKH